MTTCAVCIAVTASLVTAQDPCANSLLMENLDGGRRSPNYTTTHNTANLCDYQLDESAYHLSVSVSLVVTLKPNTHRRRRRHSTVQLSGVGGVY